MVPFVTRETFLYLIWIFCSKKILSNNLSNATLWVLDTCDCWTSSFDNHLDDRFIVFKNVQLSLTLRRVCVGGYVIHITSRFLFSIGAVHKFPWASLLCLAVLFVERNTSITTSQKSTTGNPSIRNPASQEMISDSVELWDTDVCFSHIQLMETKDRLPKTHKIHPRLILSPQGRQRNLSLGMNPIDNAEPCYTHDNVVGRHLCGECGKSILSIACRKLRSIL